MKTKSIRWKLTLSYAGIALLATLLLGLIMMGILTRYYAVRESNYLVETANELGLKYFSKTDLDLINKRTEEPITIDDLLERFSFYVNAQIRVLDPKGEMLANSGLPQPQLDVRVSDEKEEGEEIYQKDFTLARKDNRPFSSWLFSIQPDELSGTTIDEWDSQQRSQQVVTQAFYDGDGILLGYVELSNGPAFGRDILGSVAWGWAVAALAAVFLAGAAGMWVSRRFSTPLESLARTTTQMAEGDLSARAEIEGQDEFGLLAKSFNTMAESIETKVTALRSFVADAAHGLGTPLTALRINLELIDHEDIPSALEQVQRLDDLTRGLLDLSQLEALESEIQLKQVDLANLLQSIAEPYASRAEQAKLDFNLEIEDNLGKIPGDPAQLGTLIGNLLDNAVKFTPAGGEININLNEEDGVIHLTVADTGIGIPDEDRLQLFSRFHRGRNTSAYSGSGLGLAIVKAIADRHQAKVEVESQSDSFVISIQFPQLSSS